MTMQNAQQFDFLSDPLIHPFTEEQKERLSVLGRYVTEFIANEEEEKNVFFLMKLNRLLGDSKSPEYSRAMANVIGLQPELITKLVDMAYDGYGLALQVFLFLVDSESCVKAMMENKLAHFLIELITKSDHPFIPILSLEILTGIDTLPSYVPSELCLECAISCINMTIPCCKQGSQSYKPSIEMPTLDDCSEIATKTPCESTSSPTTAAEAKTGPKIQPLDIPSVMICHLGIKLVLIYVSPSARVTWSTLWQSLCQALASASRCTSLPVIVRHDAHHALALARQVEFIWMMFTNGRKTAKPQQVSRDWIEQAPTSKKGTDLLILDDELEE
ncbi:uncharacterized protein MONOS_13585 [Monocercomonoides exilis]|uniref:uncharacterized protein n=1 Tax=Monocercomonoides exilis TaxID=2049356 RepID=UPI00355A9E30|nr:hypothetical protein MONOS_13585 [Monocercomonoides exilis]|eukprot:MONOS_13585.1-p1 / transcript=MONOS_13585.1 / gene=MONOS_13585 / organism=Monocercomonoides_exilis_PA203 / gene_product=unspecified product / transcript_product=unspecified product / location=Mono_scaffold00849:22148-23403(-) / protein_length=331 / sequence_SO=supercontig / SO=protein_coding / is_pseudo=false